MKTIYKTTNLLLIVMAIFSCKKGETSYGSYLGSTPTSVIVPSWVSTSIIGNMPHPSDNPLTLEGVALGRELFYEKQLSGDNSLSCASCHLQELNFSDDRQFSIGTDGSIGNRQAMAIVNLAWDDLLFWDGRAKSLEEQAFGPVVNPIELHTSWPYVVSKLQANPKYPKLFKKAFGTQIIDSILTVKAIAQFERTMVSFNSNFDKYFYERELTALNSSETNGFNLFFGDAECVHCHSGPLLNDPTFRNNGLDVSLTDLGLGEITGLITDNGKFKVTTLRNIAESGPYMHDGRFATLEEVVEHYNSGVQSSSPNLDPEMYHFVGGLNMTVTEKADLVAFLHTFSDTIYLNNLDYSDPN